MSKHNRNVPPATLAPKADTPIADAMQSANPETTAPTLAVQVDTLIAEAGAAEGTMYAKAREAAKLAAAELDPAVTIIAERVKAVVQAHGVAFAKVGHNVKAIFSDALWILAAPQVKVEVPVAGAPKTAGETAKHATVPATDALNMSKNVLRDVAKQVREANGAARASGGGRPSQTVVSATPGQAITSPYGATFFDELKERIVNPGDLAKIVAIMEAAGYAVTKRDAKVLPSSASAPHTDLAAQLSMMKGAMAPASAS